MTTIGNIFLCIATIIFFALVASVFGKEPPGAGDAVVGYVWGIIIMNLAFFVCLLIVSLVIFARDGFDWLPVGKTGRIFFVFGGLVAACLTAALSGLFKYENGPVPFVLRFFSGFMPILIPLILLSTAIILLNTGLKNNLPVSVYKWPLLACFIFGAVGVGAAVVGFAGENNRNHAARVNQIIAGQDENLLRMLREIDSCDVQKNMLFILVFTGDNQDDTVRNKAVAKVKTNPEWQKELIRFLDTDWAAESFQFLASNPVDDPALFAEPVNKGILRQAELIRAEIRRSSHPSHFYEDQFTWEVDRVLRTVDRFSDNGIDYFSAVKMIRAALDEPSEYKTIRFNCIDKLDNWIKSHKQ